MRKAMLTLTATSLLLLSSVAFANTTKECIDSSGCEVVETLSSGVQVTHRVNYRDQFETSDGASYIWRGGDDDWEVVE